MSDNIQPILGTMNINYLYSSTNSNNIEVYKSIIETYLKNTGKNSIIDTAYYYGNTRTEQILGNLLEDILQNNSGSSGSSGSSLRMPKIATKVNPWYENDFTNGKLGQLNKHGIINQLNTSLRNLKVDNVEILYLHCPDYDTPIEETLETCDMLWRREKFNYLGLSNFSLKQTEEIIDVTEKNGYNPVYYYQGMYNLISRKVEEIFPLLKENQIEFWAYNPLAGGLLTGKYKQFKSSDDLDLIADNSRFKNNKIYQSIFWKPEIIENVQVQEFFELGNPKCIEYSFKWLQKYSKMSAEDKIVIGCSDVNQLTFALNVFDKNQKSIGDITEMNSLNNLYEPFKVVSPNYWY